MGGADSLVGGLGRDWLEGGAGHDTLEGGDDGDYLTGARGNDEIDGGGSADMVVSRGISDQTVDLGRGRLRGENIGRDKLFSIESFFAGSGDDKITGSDRANTLIGGFGDDLINGKDGRDEIWAGGGLDTVTGGAGADLFVFDTYGGSSYTQLRDFKHGIDHIGLVETGAADGPLAAGRFHKGTKAQDQNDLVIYNRATGRLWLDFDGDGDRPKMLIATLTTKPVLSASDFVTMGYTGDWWDL